MPKDIKGQVTGLSILVADDNRDNADSLALVLSCQGHVVHIAYDGASALEMAQALAPDVALLDIGMPALNGHDVARKIRNTPWGRSMYLVAITAWGTDKDKKHSLDAGFDRHLTKPVDLDVLASILNSRKLSG